MRNMSFSLTEAQFLDGSKDVTRRLGWKFLKPGDRVRAVRKAMGLKKGERVHPLGVIEIVSVRREALEDVTHGDVRREGFSCDCDEFIRIFCLHMGCPRHWPVTRIEFRRVGEKDQRE